MDEATIVPTEEPPEVVETKRKLLINKAIEILGRRKVVPAAMWEKAAPIVDGVVVASVSCPNEECGCAFGPIPLNGSYFGCPICKTPWFEKKEDEENVTLTRMKNRGRRKGGRKRHGRRAVRGDGG